MAKNGSTNRSAGAGAPQQSNEQHQPNNQSDQKRYSAYLVIPPSEKAPAGAKPFWQRVAPAYPHTDSDGFDIYVPQGMSLSGRITVRLDKPFDKTRDDKSGGEQQHDN